MSSSKTAVRRRKRVPKGGRKSGVEDVLIPHDKVQNRTPELKHLDTNSGGYIGGITTAGSITSISDIGQGAAGNQRVGDSVCIKGIDLRVAAYHQAGSVQGGLRFILFAYNEDTSPSVALILQGTGSAAALVSPYYSDHVQNSGLNILADFVFAGDSSPDAFYYHRVFTGSWPITYNAGTTTGAGKLFLIAISDAGLATNCANFQWWARVVYND
jgi:hypothetical protein